MTLKMHHELVQKACTSRIAQEACTSITLSCS